MLRYRVILFLTLSSLFLFSRGTASAMNLISESTFDSGSIGDWWAIGADLSIVNGQLCAATIGDGGDNIWDAIVLHSNLSLEANRWYDVHVDINAPTGLSVETSIELAVDPWTSYHAFNTTGSGQTVAHDSPFQQPLNDNDAQLVLLFGGQGAATLCIDNVQVEPPTAPPVPSNALHVNQMGYFAEGEKHATLVHSGSASQTWRLRDSGGTVVQSGSTIPFGTDDSSNLNVHIIDFSTYAGTGTDFTLEVGATVSHPFDIGDNPYGDLIYDSLRYFYYHRNSALEMPYADDPQWVRPAGPADDNVACWSGSGCSYSLDVSSGWYDAADYGKYTVSSGSTMWTLLNLYERAVHVDGRIFSQFADGTMNIPESGNGVSDLLDEVRFNLEFMLGMQVPAGQPLAGMVHHKMHNDEWHEVGTWPHEIDGAERYLTPPTTIATLNFAAVMAQCARVWETLDATLSTQCLTAAETAWMAAVDNDHQTHPDDPYNNGGGPYSNLAPPEEVTDEWYWAAAELFITTGDAQYKNFVLNSPHYGAPSQVHIGSFVVDMQGHISLSMVPNNLTASELEVVRDSILGVADNSVYLVNVTGFGVPIHTIHYYWGSNGLIANTGMVLAAAYDFTGDVAYLEATREATDYLFGRNPLGRSYVTGYGEFATQTPTSTWCANAVDFSMPPIPPGYLTGGANRLPVDPFAVDALVGCVGATCYLDHIRSYSTNEPAIGMNAGLVWVASFLLAEVAVPTVVELQVSTPVVRNDMGVLWGAIGILLAVVPAIWFGRKYFLR